ncbi:hypothetical protein [Micromonospora arida]|uniref:hypothetical protein n=1 Tax=Micromonospora arida TaxID=2203715 RepID=UPI0033C67A21
MLDALLVIGVAVTLIATGGSAPALAYTEAVQGTGNSAPWFDFDKNPSSALNSTLTAYVSVGGVRYRISQRAGSGNGSTNECLSNQGWLPNGYYWADGRDSTRFEHINKTWGNEVVRGWVWNLGSKKCSGSTTRTELFIHSQGTSGWTNSNYASNGCIKINQTDRSHLHNRFNAAYDKSNGFLQVVS